MSMEIREVKEANELAIIDELMNGQVKMYCSLKNDGTRKDKANVYNALAREDERLSDHINEVLEIVDVVVHPITIADEETGEPINTLRTVLIDKDGKNYVAVSGGIASALSRVISIVGSPEDGSWREEPLKMKIKQVKTRNGNNKVNTIELV